MNYKTGHVVGVNGNLVKVEFDETVIKNEVGFILVGNESLKGEVIRIIDGVADLQVYEDTNGLSVGDRVEFTGELLSVELGPGLLTQVYDGLQNPLPQLAQKCGFFLQRGVYLDPISNNEWDFTVTKKVGDTLIAGDSFGWVKELLFTHKIMVPFTLNGEWKITSIVPSGKYKAKDTLCVIENSITFIAKI